MKANITPEQLPLDLGDGLVLRFATPADDQGLLDLHFHALDEGEEEQPFVRILIQDWVDGKFPLFKHEDVTVVEDTRTGKIVSSMCLFSLNWRYGGTPIKVGRPELVSTHEDYRKRGLVAKQFEVIHSLSAQREEVMQVITGIPSFYRQFGYEMALQRGGGYRIYRHAYPKLAEEDKDKYRLRTPTSEEDKTFVRDLHQANTASMLFSMDVDKAIWENEFGGYTDGSDGKFEWLLIESKDGERLGYLNHSHIFWGPTMRVHFLALKPAEHAQGFIHERAVVESDAKIAATAIIDANAVVKSNAVIGERTRIGAGAVIGSNVKIGEDSIIHAGVLMYNGCEIGNRVIIHSGSVIGADGFGFVPTKDGHRKFPQVGTVLIEDDVEIGANCCIDRAALDQTVIHSGTKLDNLVQVAHGVRLGANTVIAAQTGISGSTRIGNWCIIGGQAGFQGHISVGDQSIVAAQSGVFGDLPFKSKVSGYPAKPHAQSLKVLALTFKLPDLLEKLKSLEIELDLISGELKGMAKRERKRKAEETSTLTPEA